MQLYPPARHWAVVDVQPNQADARERPAKVEGQADGDEADGEEEDAKYGHLQLLQPVNQALYLIAFIKLTTNLK